MDTSPTGPWSVLAIVLVIVLVLALAGLVLALALRRRAARRPPPGTDRQAPGRDDDDLPAFLESPPGSTEWTAPRAGGWPSLAASGPPAAPAVVHAPAGGTPRAVRRWVPVLGAVILAAVLGLTLLAVLGPAGRDGHGPHREARQDRGAAELPPPPDAPQPGDPGAGDLADAAVAPGRDGGAARLEFGGLVLEQRAVGVTATYPALEVSWDGTDAVAHLRLPTFNCLSASAPEDPAAAGCAPSVPEYADLPSPALAVLEDGGRLELSGRFPTYVRPNGSPPVWTGRVYEIRVRAVPADGEPAEGWVRAEGEIHLGSGRAPALDSPDVTVLRRD